MWRRVQRLDRRLMRHSFGARSPALDRTLIAITRAANYSRLWLLIAGALAVFGGRRGRRAAARGLVRDRDRGVRGQRPGEAARAPATALLALAPHLIPMPRSTSFPSGHSAAAFAFATGACAELPVLAPVLLPIGGRGCLLARTHRRSLPERLSRASASGSARAYSPRACIGARMRAARPSPCAGSPADPVGDCLDAVTISARSRARARRSPPRARP